MTRGAKPILADGLGSDSVIGLPWARQWDIVARVMGCLSDSLSDTMSSERLDGLLVGFAVDIMHVVGAAGIRILS